MITTLDPREAEALLAGGDVDVVDVREAHEWTAGHLPGARNVPLAALKAARAAELPRDKVLFVCARGMRSMTAAKLAEELGLREVYNLTGGTHAWAGAGLPIER